MTDTTQDTAAAAPTVPTETQRKFEIVKLNEPIVRGTTTVEELTIRAPRSGELRGLSLQELINTDIGAILKVLPRISEPPLTSDECLNLAPADLAEIGGTIRGFFMTSAERAAMEAIIADQLRKI
tara:strand:- start:508 stop:882 length:375 start_codon:yes stop_codon:yes gene_type:complete